MSALPRRARRLAGSVAAGAVVLTTALASTSLVSAQSSAQSAEPAAKPSPHERSIGGSAEARGYYDARYGKSGTARAIAARGASKAASRGATQAPS